MKKIIREDFWMLDADEAWNHVVDLQTELDRLERVGSERKTMTAEEIDRGGHALNEAGWAFIKAWQDMELPPMDGNTWNNCKQGIVYPVVKAYLDNLIPRHAPKARERERTRKEKIEKLIELGWETYAALNCASDKILDKALEKEGVSLTVTEE